MLSFQEGKSFTIIFTVLIDRQRHLFPRVQKSINIYNYELIYFFSRPKTPRFRSAKIPISRICAKENYFPKSTAEAAFP